MARKNSERRSTNRAQVSASNRRRVENCRFWTKWWKLKRRRRRKLVEKTTGWVRGSLLKWKSFHGVIVWIRSLFIAEEFSCRQLSLHINRTPSGNERRIHWSFSSSSPPFLHGPSTESIRTQKSEICHRSSQINMHVQVLQPHLRCSLTLSAFVCRRLLCVHSSSVCLLITVYLTLSAINLMLTAMQQSINYDQEICVVCVVVSVHTAQKHNPLISNDNSKRTSASLCE